MNRKDMDEALRRDELIAGLPEARVTLPYGGHVKLIDTLGSDEDIIASARMSTDGAFRGWGPFPCQTCGGAGTAPPLVPASADATPVPAPPTACLTCGGAGIVPGDEKLLRYLWTHQHMTPFEQATLVFEVEAPIFCARQIFRHRSFSFNELSARYTAFNEENAWSPPPGGWRSQGASTKQGSGDPLPPDTQRLCDATLEGVYRTVWTAYRDLLTRGVAREQARTVLPMGTFTRWRQSGTLRNWLAYLELRLHPHAQLETRQVAAAQAMFIGAVFPRTWALFEEDMGDLFATVPGTLPVAPPSVGP